jgi:hypothetical protein
VARFNKLSLLSWRLSLIRPASIQKEHNGVLDFRAPRSTARSKIPVNVMAAMASIEQKDFSNTVQAVPAGEMLTPSLPTASRRPIAEAIARRMETK